MTDMKSSISCWYLSIDTNDIAMTTQLIKTVQMVAMRTSCS
jgi:hypothetical protein